MITRYFLRRVFCLLGATCAWVAFPAASATVALPVTPQMTNVEAGHSIVISALFLNAAGQPAAGETVNFGNDACGTFPNGRMSTQVVADAVGIATTKFTARYPGGIMCRVSAAAGAYIIFDVITYGVHQVTFFAETIPANLQPGQPFSLVTSVRMWNYKLANVELAARILPGTSAATVAPASGNSAAGGEVTFYITPQSMGDYEIELSLRGRSVRMPISATYQGVWGGGTQENGWGVALTQHGDRLAAGWYYYDKAGRATWSIMPPCEWNTAYTECAGTLFNSTGTPFTRYNTNEFKQAAVGTLVFSFIDANRATLKYVVDGVSGEKALSRLDFSAGAAPSVINYTDVWWGGSAQKDWGVALFQQRASLVGSWYTYDSQGRATWFVIGGGMWISPTVFQGNLLQATASAVLGANYNAAAFTPVNVGAVTLNFSDANNALMTYRVDGVEQTKSISRLMF